MKETVKYHFLQCSLHQAAVQYQTRAKAPPNPFFEILKNRFKPQRGASCAKNKPSAGSSALGSFHTAEIKVPLLFLKRPGK